MSAQEYYRHLSLEAFQQAYRSASRARVWRRFTGKPFQTLLPFEPVRARLGTQNGVERQSRNIPLAEIAGSLDRWKEFDRDFRPLSTRLRERWTAVADLTQTSGWPPIQVQQVGNLYFVEDGHHRVSVAKQLGFSDIEANVTEYPLPTVFDPHDSLDSILDKIERSQGELFTRSACCCRPLCSSVA